MKGWIIYLIMVISLVISYFIFLSLPEFIRQGGPLIVLLIFLMFMVVTFMIERWWTLKQAGGKGNVGQFVRKIKTAVHNGQLDDAIEACRKQGGSLANVVGAGLERYKALVTTDVPPDEVIDETRRAFEEANALETPLLERNLTALSTIASIGTMVGLLGTTIGMIRSFHAMSHAGAPDAIAARARNLRGAHQHRRRPDSRDSRHRDVQLLLDARGRIQLLDGRDHVRDSAAAAASEGRRSWLRGSVSEFAST